MRDHLTLTKHSQDSFDKQLIVLNERFFVNRTETLDNGDKTLYTNDYVIHLKLERGCV